MYSYPAYRITLVNHIKIQVLYYVMLIFKCEDGCQEVHSFRNSIKRIQCKCLKWMIRCGEYQEEIKKPNYKSCSGMALHRYLWIQTYGEIPEGMIIHHIDGDNLNNNINNLECLNHSEHGYRHVKLQNANLVITY